MNRNVCIVGFGKLGQSIFKLIDNIDKLTVTNVVDLMPKEKFIESNEGLKDKLSSVRFNTSVTDELSSCDIIIDSTVRDAFVNNIKEYAKLRKSMIIATTNIEDIMPEVIKLAEYNPIVREPNFDFGLLKFRDMTKDIYDKFGYMSPSIVEVHHDKKVDVSGTAKLLVNELNTIDSYIGKTFLVSTSLVASTIYISLENENIILDYNVSDSNEDELINIFKKYFNETPLTNATYDFSFTNSKKFDTNYEGVNITSIREGNIVGIHTVKLDCKATNEFISITHEVKSRDVFASGIVKIAQDLDKFENGMHSIREFL